MTRLFEAAPALIGMIHLQALPGTPAARLPVSQVLAAAVEEATILAAAGFDALLIENMHDRPYLKREVGPEIVAAMAVVGRAVREASGLPLGVQVLAGANRQALAVALAAGASFVRAEGAVFAHVADEGVMESDAGSLLRYRKAIGAEHVQVIVDIKKKHAAHAITADVSLVDTARAAAFFLADGVIVTGAETGQAADPEEVRAVAEAVPLPTWVGSGITPDNAARYRHAAALVVGSSLKEEGRWSGALVAERARAMVAAVRTLRGAPAAPGRA